MPGVRPADVPAMHGVPLVVDVDGTLLRTDLLLEGALRLVATRPRKIPGFLGALWRGKAAAKAYLADAIDLPLALMPRRAEVAQLIANAKTDRRTVILASGANARFVTALAAEVGADVALGSDERTNLTAQRKLDRLKERYRAFDYVGNGWADRPLWREAREAYGVGVGWLCRLSMRRIRPDLRELDGPPSYLRVVVRQLRLHQWTKNALLILPVLAAHLRLTGEVVARLALGMLAFSLLASAVYVVNDLLDLDSDRAHRSKRNRPVASGRLSIPAAVLVAVACVAGSALVAATLPQEFRLVLGAYAVIAAAYALDLKHRLLVDILVLATLYTVRIVAGAALFDVTLSRWFLAFSVFFFWSLALAKRVADLRRQSEAEATASRRRYRVDDAPVLTAAGVGAVAAASLVYCLYITSDDIYQLYSRPDLLWLAFPLLLYWQTRIWVFAHRGELDSDPVIFAVTDAVSYLALILFLFAVRLAI